MARTEFIRKYLFSVSIHFWLENQLFAVVSVTSKPVSSTLMGSFTPLKTPGNSGSKTELTLNFLTVFFVDDLLYLATCRGGAWDGNNILIFKNHIIINQPLWTNLKVLAGCWLFLMTHHCLKNRRVNYRCCEWWIGLSGGQFDNVDHRLGKYA